jgi:hypothetical protein
VMYPPSPWETGSHSIPAFCHKIVHHVCMSHGTSIITPASWERAQDPRLSDWSDKD